MLCFLPGWYVCVVITYIIGHASCSLYFELLANRTNDTLYQYAIVSNISDLDEIIQTFTIQAWYYLIIEGYNDEQNELYPGILSNRQEGGDALNPGMFYGLNMLQQVPFAQYGYNFWNKDLDINVSSFEWHHFVTTVDNDTLSYYVDGELFYNVTDVKVFLETLQSNDTFYIGWDQYNPRETRFQGYIDEIAIWKRVLNINEIKLLYSESLLYANYNNSFMVNDSDLIHYWPININNINTVNENNQILYDIISNSNAHLGISSDIDNFDPQLSSFSPNFPTFTPTSIPSYNPTVEPTDQPSDEPTVEPSNQPSILPTNQPSIEPTVSPTNETNEPSLYPSEIPSLIIMPTIIPSSEPSSVDHEFETSSISTTLTVSFETTRMSMTIHETTEKTASTTSDSNGDGSGNGGSKNSDTEGITSTLLNVLIICAIFCLIVTAFSVVCGVFCWHKRQLQKTKKTSKSVQMIQMSSQSDVGLQRADSGDSHYSTSTNQIRLAMSTNDAKNNNTNHNNNNSNTDDLYSALNVAIDSSPVTPDLTDAEQKVILTRIKDVNITGGSINTLGNVDGNNDEGEGNANDIDRLYDKGGATNTDFNKNVSWTEWNEKMFSQWMENMLRQTEYGQFSDEKILKFMQSFNQIDLNGKILKIWVNQAKKDSIDGTINVQILLDKLQNKIEYSKNSLVWDAIGQALLDLIQM